jgi:hypothetical protein
MKLFLYSIMQRIFCRHLKWNKTYNTLGSKLEEHQCQECNKKIHRNKFDPPISYVAFGLKPKLKPKKQCAIHYASLTLPHEEMNEHQKTDVVLNMEGIPFMTLTESKLHNVWYHEDLPYLFILSSRGFRVYHKGTKEGLFKRGFGR